MRASLRSGVTALLLAVVTRSSLAAEPRAVVSTVSFYGNRSGVQLQRPETQSDGVSEWATVCVLPCEGLHLNSWTPYRVAGPDILASEPFQLLPMTEPQVVNIRAKSPSDRSSARGLLIGGLVTVGVGVVVIASTAIIVSNIHEGEPGIVAPIAALSGGGVGLLIVIIGAIPAAVGGTNLANAHTSVTVEARAPDPGR